jgi:pyruvate dehydrogenase E2 component (dihydrolipoamide acetyltransferase)
MNRIIMPRSGQTMEEGIVRRWLKVEGDSVRAGEVILEIETDKAVAEVPAPESGVLRKILVPEGVTVPVLTPLAYVGALHEELPGDSTPEQAKAVPAESAAPFTATEHARLPVNRPKLISPRARRLAAEHNIDLAVLAGSGPEGRITESDVQDYIRRAAQPQAGVRRISRKQDPAGKQLQRSKQTVPHFYLTLDVKADRLRALIDAIRQKDSVTVTDVIVKAVALALVDCPEVNCRWDGDDLVYNEFVNVGIAVDAEAGLLVTTVAKANSDSLTEIAERRAALVAKAREGKISSEPCSLTVSNLGMHGIREFAAIINPPEIAVLAVGAITPVVQMDNPGSNLKLAKIMTLTLSSDHRALSGVQAARFLNSVKKHLEEPESWMDEVKS